MRLVLISASLALAVAPVWADSPARIDVAHIGAPCGIFALHHPRDPALVLAANISIAQCLADQHIRSVTIVDTPTARDQLNQAVAHSLAILDDVIARGGPAQQILAQHAKGDILVGLAVRLRNAAPARGLAAGRELTAIEQRHAIVDDLVRRWLAEADDCFQSAVDLARSHPGIERDPVIAAVVHHSEDELYPTQTALR